MSKYWSLPGVLEWEGDLFNIGPMEKGCGFKNWVWSCGATLGTEIIVADILPILTSIRCSCKELWRPLGVGGNSRGAVLCRASSGVHWP